MGITSGFLVVLNTEQFVRALRIKSKHLFLLIYPRQILMSRKKLALGTVAVLISFSFTVAVLVTSFSIIEAINPIAAATAITVAVVGIIWFKKTSN